MRGISYFPAHIPIPHQNPENTITVKFPQQADNGHLFHIGRIRMGAAALSDYNKRGRITGSVTGLILGENWK
jgi:hypothetical protein